MTFNIGYNSYAITRSTAYFQRKMQKRSTPVTCSICDGMGEVIGLQLTGSYSWATVQCSCRQCSSVGYSDKAVKYLLQQDSEVTCSFDYGIGAVRSVTVTLAITQCISTGSIGQGRDAVLRFICRCFFMVSVWSCSWQNRLQKQCANVTGSIATTTIPAAAYTQSWLQQ